MMRHSSPLTEAHKYIPHGRWLTATMVAVGLALIIGVGLLIWPHGYDEDRAWEKALASGVLRVGMDASYPPFEFIDAHGEVVGFDVDLAHEIGRRLGFEVTLINIAYDGLYDALLTGQVEVLLSALAAIPEYEGKALFTEPYFNAGEQLVVRVESQILIMPDMEGRRLAVEFGSGGDVEARKWERRLTDLTVVRYPDPGAALLAVVNGEVDAALVDGIAARLGAGEHVELALAGNVTDLPFAAAVHPESLTLRGKLDEVIREMLKDGTVDLLIDRWFNQQEGG